MLTIDSTAMLRHGQDFVCLLQNMNDENKHFENTINLNSNFKKKHHEKLNLQIPHRNIEIIF